jgi:ABC-type molybdate transport system substrate-binding protein
MHRFFSLTFLLALFLPGCGMTPPSTPIPASAAQAPSTLTVFAAVSLTDAFTGIGVTFENEDNVSQVVAKVQLGVYLLTVKDSKHGKCREKIELAFYSI